LLDWLILLDLEKGWGFFENDAGILAKSVFSSLNLGVWANVARSFLFDK